jgi:tetratricopeptide (TPR) repeat protein
MRESGLWPDAYVWGVADVLRVGVEGRHASLLLFGQRHEGTTPWYFFPGTLSAKLPLGTLALMLLALVVLARRDGGRTGLAGARAALLLALWSAGYLATLLLGNSGYAGIRHALPVLPGIALLAALPLMDLLSFLRARRQPTRGDWLPLVTAGAVIGLAWSALPVTRPWEYFNELVGGQREAWRYFNDEGLDLGQRSRELASYYDAHVRGSGEAVYDYYGMVEEEQKGRKLVFNSIADEELDSEFLNGTVFLTAAELPPSELYDYAGFRARPPRARFGNLLIFQGRYHVPWLKIARRLVLAERALTSEPPDLGRAAELLSEAAALSPGHYDVAFGLGNVLLELGDRGGAIAAYEQALRAAPPGHVIVPGLTRQLQELRQLGFVGARPLRSPWLE